MERKQEIRRKKGKRKKKGKEEENETKRIGHTAWRSSFLRDPPTGGYASGTSSQQSRTSRESALSSSRQLAIPSDYGQQATQTCDDPDTIQCLHASVRTRGQRFLHLALHKA